MESLRDNLRALTLTDLITLKKVCNGTLLDISQRILSGQRLHENNREHNVRHQEDLTAQRDEIQKEIDVRYAAIGLSLSRPYPEQ